jgi:hypothetical protein
VTPIPEENDDEDNPEEWVNNTLALGLWLDTWEEQRSHLAGTTKVFQATQGVSAPCDMLTFLTSTDRARTLDGELPSILEFLSNGKRLNGHTSEELNCLHRQAWNFFIHNEQLW